MGFSGILREVSKEKEVMGAYCTTHVWGRWIRLQGSTSGKSSYIFFHNHICNDMLLIATCKKMRAVLYLDSFTFIVRGIRDQILKILTPCVVRWQ
jgi:hypothetical protein